MTPVETCDDDNNSLTDLETRTFLLTQMDETFCLEIYKIYRNEKLQA